MEKTPFKIIDKYAFDEHRFKTIEEAQAWIRKNTMPDYIVIDDILYTMEEYDMGGQDTSYYNKRTGKTLSVKNKDRYKFGFGDSELSIDEIGCYRNDIDYTD